MLECLSATLYCLFITFFCAFLVIWRKPSLIRCALSVVPTPNVSYKMASINCSLSLIGSDLSLQLFIMI